MSAVRDLYQELILDHGRRPRNLRRLEGASHSAEGYNPLCGDRVTVFLKMSGDLVTDASFEGSGCAISMASASLMTESLKGKTRAQIEALFESFHDLVTGERPSSGEHLAKLAVFSGVSEFPTRVKCATLSWHTVRSALNDEGRMVSTE